MLSMYDLDWKNEEQLFAMPYENSFHLGDKFLLDTSASIDAEENITVSIFVMSLMQTMKFQKLEMIPLLIGIG